MEILTRSVMKKEATDLENAGIANLQIREKPLEEEEKSDDEDEPEEAKENKKGAKKVKKAKKDQSSRKRDEEIEEELKKKREEALKKEKEENAAKEEPVMEISASKEAEKKFKCSTCKNATFDTNGEFRNHFKTDWHNFNNKRKIEKKDAVTEDEFLDQLLDDELTMKKRDR